MKIKKCCENIDVLNDNVEVSKISTLLDSNYIFTFSGLIIECCPFCGTKLEVEEEKPKTKWFKHISYTKVGLDAYKIETIISSFVGYQNDKKVLIETQEIETDLTDIVEIYKLFEVK